MKIPNQYQPRKKLLKQVQRKVKHLNRTGLLRMLVAIEAAEIQGLVKGGRKDG